ncbi:hypothetical protein Pmani_024661 [Petrolisthes manimaculis]|uniref:Uncharacterized protein n=1 Tax=Petrolisthes manimaculis TaxID=1843537 RepID=A0AAE1TYG9_9EUCA|nr:hypothetical protein Pmani_024661 [Petrolisthes manimaculis]
MRYMFVIEQLEGLVLRTTCSYNGDTHQDGDVIEGPINCYNAECVGTTVQLVKEDGCTPCTKMTTPRFKVEKDLVPNIREEIMARGKPCSANGETKWNGHRLDKVVEDCIWIRCDGDTGLYVLEMNPFAACKCPTTTTEVTTTDATTTEVTTTDATTTEVTTTDATTTEVTTTDATTTEVTTTEVTTTEVTTTEVTTTDATTTDATTTDATTTDATTTDATTTDATTTDATTTDATTTDATTTEVTTTTDGTTTTATTTPDSCEAETTTTPVDSCDDTTPTPPAP